MPKITVLGRDPRKKIKVGKVLDNKFDWLTVKDGDIEVYDNVDVICINYDGKGNDLLFGYDDSPALRSNGSLYIGQLNDGV